MAECQMKMVFPDRAKDLELCESFWRAVSCKDTLNWLPRHFRSPRWTPRRTFARSAIPFPCWACCGQRAMAEKDFCVVRFARTNGAFGEFFVQRAAKNARRNCLFTWRNSFRTFGWSAATLANI